MFGIYKYVYDGEIIYIGKSDNSILNRVKSHKNEEKFKPYLDKAVVYYIECKNPAHTQILETYLINKYKPCLNASFKYEDDLDIDIQEPEWHLLSELKETEKNAKQPKKLGKIWYEHRLNDIESLKTRIKNLEWLEPFLSRFYGMYDIEFSVDYSEENLEKYHRLFESGCLSQITENGVCYFGLKTYIKVNEDKSKIRIIIMTSHLKDLNFWDNYELYFQNTKDEYREKIAEIISKIKDAGYDYNE